MTPEQRDILKDNWFTANSTAEQQQPDIVRELASAHSSNPLDSHHDGQAPEYERIYADLPSSGSSSSSSSHVEPVPTQTHDHPLRSNQPDLPQTAHYTAIPSDPQDRTHDNDVGRALTMGSSVYTESIAAPADDTDGLSRNRYYGALGSSNIHLMDIPLKERDANRNASTGTGAEVNETRAGMTANEKRRLVSGKIAEEGRGGQWAMRRREVSGAAAAFA